MKKNKKDNIIWILPPLFIFLVLLMLGMCTPKINNRYIIENAKIETLELFLNMKGEVEAKDLLPIGLDIQLGIDDVYFKEGDRVKKGDIIIKFSDYKSKDLETKLYNQKQELALKTSQLRYLQEQYKLGADVTDQIQKLMGEIKALEGELATASKEKSLVQRVVMSPIDGYIVKLNAVKGGTTDSLTPVVILAKTHDIKIVSEPFPANKLQYVNLGNKAEIKAINNSETKFEGILYKISDSGIPDLKVLEFLTSSFADVTLNQILKIRLIYQKKENVITAPLNAVVKKKSRKNGEKYIVYLINKDNKITEKEVQIGINNGERIEIYGTDIKEGLEIVVNPDDKIRNNIIVKRRDLITEKKKKEEELSKLEKENEKKQKEIEKNEIEIIRLKRGENGK